MATNTALKKFWFWFGCCHFLLLFFRLFCLALCYTVFLLISFWFLFSILRSFCFSVSILRSFWFTVLIRGHIVLVYIRWAESVLKLFLMQFLSVVWLESPRFMRNLHVRLFWKSREERWNFQARFLLKFRKWHKNSYQNFLRRILGMLLDI